MDCLFCQIINGDIQSQIVYEDDEALAFADVNPQAPHHYLIIPKRHIASMNDLNTDDAALCGKLTLVAQQLAKQYKLSEDGYRIVMNCNEYGGQTVFHLHLHLLGGRILNWPPG